jgi:recombination protein RecT
MTAERMIRIVLTQVSMNPKIAECSRESVFGALMQASQLGLEVGVNGQAYLIPYKNQCQFIPGWRGLADLLARSEKATARTNAVYEGDEFEYELGTSAYIKHRPGENYGDESKITHVYAIGRLFNAPENDAIMEVWTAARVRKHLAKYNKVGSSHYANRHFEMYARKVVYLQVLKYLPLSVQLQSAIEFNDHAEIGAIDGREAFESARRQIEVQHIQE